jgi:hypothetical protein
MPNLDQILPPKKEPQPLDPVSDIVAARQEVYLLLLSPVKTMMHILK